MKNETMLLALKEFTGAAYEAASIVLGERKPPSDTYLGNYSFVPSPSGGTYSDHYGASCTVDTARGTANGRTCSDRSWRLNWSDRILTIGEEAVNSVSWRKDVELFAKHHGLRIQSPWLAADMTRQRQALAERAIRATYR